MIFFFIFLKWKFDRNKFADIVNNSINVPLFVLCYSPSCNHCHGLPQIIENLTKAYNNDNNIMFTTVNCQDDSAGCSLFPMIGTPYIGMVIGTNKRYWPNTAGRTFEELTNFIDLYHHEPFKEIHDDNDFAIAKKVPTGGGSSFIVELNDENDKKFVELTNYVSHYSIFNDSFYYKINPKAKDIKITAFTNEFCPFVYKGSSMADIKKFIDENKFGIDHSYSFSEFKALTLTRKCLIYFENKPLAINQKESFINLPKGHCGIDTVYGWANVEEHKKLLTETNSTTLDIPFLFGSDPKSVCTWKYFRKLDSINDSNFFDLFNSNKCTVTESNAVVRICLYAIGMVLSLCLFFVLSVFEKKIPNKLL